MRKSIAILAVMGVVLFVEAIALIALGVMAQEAHIVERKIRRLRAYYAANAGRVYALEQLRKDNTTSSYTLTGIGMGVEGYGPAPHPGYNVDVSVTPDPLSDYKITVTAHYW
jgi:hypothetical protein